MHPAADEAEEVEETDEDLGREIWEERVSGSRSPGGGGEVASGRPR